MRRLARGEGRGTASFDSSTGELPHLIRSITLADGNLSTTSIGFGCASLYRVPSRARRLRLLEAAFEAGVLHFDVAPMYGLGMAEAELSRFAHDKRAGIIIATKFGITPTTLGRRLARLQSPARKLVLASSSLGARLRTSATGPSRGNIGGLLYESVGYDAVSARRGLENSLRALRTDYIDLLLLHEPEPDSIRGDELCAYLQAAQAAGHIRSWGLAGERERCVRAIPVLPAAPPVVQLRYEITRPLRTTGLLAHSCIQFGVFDRLLPLLLAHINGDSSRVRRWSNTIGLDVGAAEVVGELLLRCALRDNPDGVTLISTSQEQRLRASARIAAQDPLSDGPQVQAFRTLVSRELLKEDDLDHY